MEESYKILIIVSTYVYCELKGDLIKLSAISRDCNN